MGTASVPLFALSLLPQAVCKKHEQICKLNTVPIRPTVPSAINIGTASSTAKPALSTTRRKREYTAEADDRDCIAIKRNRGPRLACMTGR